MKRTLENRRLVWGMEQQEDWEWEWECFLDSFNTLIEEFNPNGCDFSVEVANFGWRLQDGQAPCISATTGQELLQKILPKTQCLFNVWYDVDANEIIIQNFHHDSPTGNEIYTIRLLTENAIASC